MEVKVFTDAAEAFEKLIRGLRDLVALIGSSTAAGVEFLENRAAQKSLDDLSKLLANMTFETYMLGAGFMPKMKRYLNDPTDEKWTELYEEIASVMDGLDRLAEELKKNSPTIASQMFFPVFAESILKRQAMIRLLRSTQKPTSRAEIEELRIFFREYDNLLLTITEANYRLADYLNQREERPR